MLPLSPAAAGQTVGLLRRDRYDRKPPHIPGPAGQANGLPPAGTCDAFMAFNGAPGLPGIRPILGDQRVHIPDACLPLNRHLRPRTGQQNLFGPRLCADAIATPPAAGRTRCTSRHQGHKGSQARHADAGKIITPDPSLAVHAGHPT